MANSSKENDTVLAAVDQIVQPYLRKKIGSELANLFFDRMKNLSIQSSDTVRAMFTEQAMFVQLCRELIEIRLEGYDGPFLSIVLDKNELASLVPSFTRDYDARFGENNHLLNAGNAFDRLLAPELVDILGEDLVKYLQQLYISEINVHIGVDDDKRFLAAIEKLIDVVPLLHEVEYMERIRGIEDVLSKQMTNDAKGTAAFSAVCLEDGIEQIIIPDLAAILGEGPILESLVQAAHDQCTGIFTDEIARFSRFVKKLNGSDIILNMFGDHWTADKEQEWIEAFRKWVTGNKVIT